MRIRRILTATIAAGLAVGALAGCTSGGQSDDGGEGADGATTLDMWVFAELHGQVYEEMAEKWNEENPDKAVDLNLTVYPYQDMHDKLLLADLTEAAAPYADDIVQARLDLYSRDGKVYGYPTHVGAFVAFYNTELLEAAGVDYTAIKTWDDFAAAGTAYNEATNKAFSVASTSVYFTEPLAIAQNGGQLFEDDGLGAPAVNSPEVVETMQMFQDMKDSGAISTIPGGSPDSEEAFGAINKGDYAAIVYPAWYTSRFVDYMPDLAGKIAIAPAPQVEGSDVLTIGGGGTGTTVMAASENKELASEFLAFTKLSLEANVAVWEVLGFDPVNMSVWEDEAVTHNPDNKFNKYFQTNLFDVLNSVKDGIGHFQSFSNENLPTVDNQFRTVTLNEIYENGTPAEEALDQAQETVLNELGQ